MTDSKRERWSLRTRVSGLVRKVIPSSIRQRMQTIEPRFLSFLVQIFRLSSEANILDIEDIRMSRVKDTVYIMGCGYSINDITGKEWDYINRNGDVFSFNNFYKGYFVPVTYHACGEIGMSAPNFETVLFSAKHRQAISNYYTETLKNSGYASTIFFLRYGINRMSSPVTTAVWSVFFSKIFRGRKLSLYWIDAHYDTVDLPSNDINMISHHEATLSDVVNISYLIGYKTIVLVGVDLYDRRYFWLGDSTREEDARLNKTYSDVHQTADPMVRLMDAWNKYFMEKGVRLYVYNPRSLLHAVLPLYSIGEFGEKPREQ